jgi:hypothetical protein
MPSLAHSVAGLNDLSLTERLSYVRLLVPPALLARFEINPDTLRDKDGSLVVDWLAQPGGSQAEISIFHMRGAQDPIAYFHLTDTVSQQIHILLAVINDPASPRFDVDRLPDGSPTLFGAFRRNQTAERAAFAAGLAPGQVRRGLRMLQHCVQAFDMFVAGMGHDMYFVEPLHYHNAVLFERYGFAYQQGRRWMQSLNTRFSESGDLVAKLDGSTPFRDPIAVHSIRGRSWAIHDGLLGEPYTGVTMYKRIGQHSGVDTFPGGVW